ARFGGRMPLSRNRDHVPPALSVRGKCSDSTNPVRPGSQKHHFAVLRVEINCLQRREAKSHGIWFRFPLEVGGNVLFIFRWLNQMWNHTLWYVRLFNIPPRT